MAYGQLNVSKRQALLRLGHKGFARHGIKQIQHHGIEHLPSANLLLYHVKSSRIVGAAKSAGLALCHGACFLKCKHHYSAGR